MDDSWNWSIRLMIFLWRKHDSKQSMSMNETNFDKFWQMIGWIQVVCITCKWMTWILDGCQIYQLVEISLNWWMKQFNEISC
jgi:hypothetical protein